MTRGEWEKDIEYKVLINNTNNKFKLEKTNIANAECNKPNNGNNDNLLLSPSFC